MALTPREKRNLAHLLRRAGFGARPDEWLHFSELGQNATLDELLHPEKVPDTLAEVLKAIGGDYVDFDNLESIRHWWLYRMVHTRRPLEEKMTLFWHNHFATSYFKVNSARAMWRQNEVFRKHALGNFRSLLMAVARDAAMLVWLDGAQNRAGQPNENFARELMELFTMGVGSGYTENDIKEAARSLTGWRYEPGGQTFAYDPFLHDDGYKIVLGQGGNFHGDDVIDIVARHPATAKFVCTKLFKFFVHDNPTDTDIAPLAQAYLESGCEMRAVLQTLFNAPVFYADTTLYARIKSPTEFVVTTMRTLDAPMLAVQNLAGTIAAMGQDLFNPPNVKGWPEGQAWINTRTLLMRINFATQLAGEMQRRGVMMRLIQDGMLGVTNAPMTPEAGVAAMWNALMPGLPLPATTNATLLNYAREGTAETLAPARIPGLLNLVMSAPEYELC